MTKQNLQKELKEKIKEGIKPSDLKKLKRSKSADDISSESEANALQKENSELKKQLEQTTLALSELTKIRNNTPPAPLLQEQLKEKQKEIETLREKGEDSAKQIETLREKIEKLQEQLEEQHQKLISSLEEQDLALAPSPQTNENELTELDQALIVRHKSLQDWFKEFSKRKKLEQEFDKDIEEVSAEMIDLDEKIDKLRGENRQLKLTNQSLQRDLELAHRAVKWRENPIRFSYSDNSAPYPFLKHALYSLAIAVFTMWLVNSFKKT